MSICDNKLKYAFEILLITQKRETKAYFED